MHQQSFSKRINSGLGQKKHIKQTKINLTSKGGCLQHCCSSNVHGILQLKNKCCGVNTSTPFAVHYQKIYYHWCQPQTHKRENAFILMNWHSSMLLSRSIKIFFCIEIDIHWRRYATICTKGHSIAPKDDH